MSAAPAPDAGGLTAALVGERRPPKPDALAKAHRRARVVQALLATYAAVVLGVTAWHGLDPFLSGPLPDVVIAVAFLATAAAFAAWQVAAYRLVPVLTGRPSDRSPGWAAGGYLVPFMNLWVPFQTMSEIRDAVDPDGLDGQFGSVERRPPPVHVWWTLWVAFTVGGRVFNRIPEPPYAGGVTGYEVFAIALVAVQLAVTAAAFVVVRRVDRDLGETAGRLRMLLDDRTVCTAL